jgi:hypothetical protein
MSGYRAPRLILSLAICCSPLLSGCQANPNVIDDWAQRWKPKQKSYAGSEVSRRKAMNSAIVPLPRPAGRQH